MPRAPTSPRAHAVAVARPARPLALDLAAWLAAFALALAAAAALR